MKKFFFTLLNLFLSFYVLDVFGAEGVRKEVYLFWAPTERQVATWTGAGNAFPESGPAVSVKVALPPGTNPTLVVISETWIPVASKTPFYRYGETLSLGTGSFWRGIPYQEVLVFPLRVSPETGSVELLTSCSFKVVSEKEWYTGAQFQGTTHGLAEASQFANPDDALALQGFPREEAEPYALEGQEVPLATVTPVFRLSVSKDGIFRITYAQLVAAGLNPSGVDPRNFHLKSRGVELPIVVEGEGDGVFGSSDSVVFYGQKFSVRNRDIWNGGDFTDTNIYFLYADNTLGLRPSGSVDGSNKGYTAVTQVPHTVWAETNNYFNSNEHIRPNRDLWYWSPFYGGYPGAYATYTVSTPRAAAATATIKAQVAGFGSVLHGARLTVNAVNPTTGSVYTEWQGPALLTQIWTFTSGLVAGSNTFKLISEYAGYQCGDAFEVTYNRTLQVDSYNLEFKALASNTRYAPFGFSTTPYIFELSETDAATGLYKPKPVTGATISGTSPNIVATFDIAASASSRRYVLSSSPYSCDKIEVSSQRNLSDSALGADLLIITHPDFNISGSNEWQTFLTRRGQKLDVEVVEIQDVYDNYNYGIFDPTAIRSFLQVALTSWSKKPAYILLVGDGTYDYKDYMNQKSGEPTYKNWVPTMMFEDLWDTLIGRYSGDCWLADIDSDGYPETSVGRIPARTFTAFCSVLQKIREYEDQTLSGTWYKNVLYAADRGETSEELEAFEGYNNYLKNTFTVSPWSSTTAYYFSEFGGTDYTGCAQKIRDNWPLSALVMYSGHSGFRYWGYYSTQSIFSAEKVRNSNTQSDIDLLSTGTHLPFMVNGTCNTSAFDQPNTPCLMEELLAPSTKGAVATCGPTTVSFPSDGEAFTNAMFSQAFGRPKTRCIGDLVEVGRFGIPTSSTRAIYSHALLGDPSMRILMPAPPPPATLSASAGNASAHLSWSTPSPAPYGYNIYQSSEGGTNWVKRNASAVLVTSFDDSGLTNMNNYFYYVASVDAAGFEGPPSNTATVQPVNPNPPVIPTGLSVLDEGLLTQLSVSWNANAETDISGYTIYWGDSPGVYTHSQSCTSAATSSYISGLAQGQTYYISLSASNTSGHESAKCPEESGRPTDVRLAIHPPAMVVDLMVTRSGNDLVLNWSKPVCDDQKKAVTVSQFYIYRVVGDYNWNLDTVGTTDPNAKITIPAPSAQSYFQYTDTGAVSSGDRVNYLVVALDSNGDRSSASNYPPSQVYLFAEKTPDDKVLLSFDPVTTDISGRTGIIIDHYNLFGFFPADANSDHVRPSPYVFLESIGPILPHDSCTGTAVYCDTRANIPLFYTVIAVDNRGNTSRY